MTLKGKDIPVVAEAEVKWVLIFGACQSGTDAIELIDQQKEEEEAEPKTFNFLGRNSKRTISRLR